MLSFLSLSSFVTPSSSRRTLSDGEFDMQQAQSSLWQSLKQYGFSEDVITQSNAVLDPRRWQEASRKLGEAISYIDHTHDAAQGMAMSRQSGSSFFVDIMQQFCESLLAEIEALSQIERALPELHRSLGQQEMFPVMQHVTQATIHAAEKLMMQYHALIPARLSEFRRWAEAYALLPDARAFFFDYTKIRDGQGLSLDALFIRFSVV
ncbi:MAG: hypothetical protein K2Q12_02870 [Rickettsiales bacterium]|nr:hypothetical protein [Rickettsiales bacterium]